MAESSFPQKVVEAPFPTRHYGDFRIAVYTEGTKDHIALVRGEVEEADDVPVRVQSECLPGTALQSADCECADQLLRSFEIVTSQETGVILYMREEGRGLGLVNKIKALAHKNKGLDTFAAVVALGLEPDVRDHRGAAFILKDLGLLSVRLITNNPEKITALEAQGIRVSDRIPVEIPATEATRIHLAAKQRAGHLLEQKF